MRFLIGEKCHGEVFGDRIVGFVGSINELPDVSIANELYSARLDL